MQDKNPYNRRFHRLFFRLSSRTAFIPPSSCLSPPVPLHRTEARPERPHLDSSIITCREEVSYRKRQVFPLSSSDRIPLPFMPFFLTHKTCYDSIYLMVIGNREDDTCG